jgi:hypothetical protein
MAVMSSPLKCAQISDWSGSMKTRQQIFLFHHKLTQVTSGIERQNKLTPVMFSTRDNQAAI